MLEIVDRVWDSVCGYIELTEIEKRILSTDPIQRLRRLNPTPGSSYVYPELTGSRFSHSLGVMHLAWRIIEQLKRKRARAKQLNHNEWGDDTVQNVRLAGLLHDIGHGPFSHTFDQFLRKISTNHEQIGCHILMQHEALGSILEDQINEIAYIAWGKKVLTQAGIDEKIIEKYHKRNEMRLFSDIIHGPPHCADILDFLVRDSQHAGVVYGHVDIERLLAYMDNFENKLGVEDKAFDAYESMILARYYMFKTVYFHRSSRAMERLLLDALDVINEHLKKENGKDFLEVVQGIKKGNVQDSNRYMDFDDYFAYTKMRHYKKQEPKIKELAEQIFYRQIPKRIYTRKETEFEEKMGSFGLSEENLIDFWLKKIIDKAKQRGIEISKKDIFIDIPSLTTIPLHASSVTIEDLKEYLFTRKNGVKESFYPKASIIEKMSPKEYEIQLYIRQAPDTTRKILENICEEIWEEAPKNKETSTQA